MVEANVFYKNNQVFILWVTEEGKRNKHVDVLYQIFREPTGNRIVRL